MKPTLKTLPINLMTSMNQESAPELLTDEEARHIKNLIIDSRGIVRHGFYGAVKLSDDFGDKYCYDMKVISWRGEFYIVLVLSYLDQLQVGQATYIFYDHLLLSNPMAKGDLFNIDKKITFLPNYRLGQMVSPISVAVFPDSFFVCGLKSFVDDSAQDLTTIWQFGSGDTGFQPFKTSVSDANLARCITQYQNRLLLAGSPNQPSTFYWSKPDKDKTIDPENYASSGKDEVMTAILPLRNSIVLPTDVATYRCDGIPPVAFVKLFDAGCPTGRAGIWKDLIYFLDEEGHLSVMSGEVGKRERITKNRMESWISDYELSQPPVELLNRIYFPNWTQYSEYGDSWVNYVPTKIQSASQWKGYFRLLVNPTETTDSILNTSGIAPFGDGIIPDISEVDGWFFTQCIIIHPDWLNPHASAYPSPYEYGQGRDVPLIIDKVRLTLAAEPDKTADIIAEVHSIHYDNLWYENGGFKTNIEGGYVPPTTKFITKSSPIEISGDSFADYTFTLENKIRLSPAVDGHSDVWGYWILLKRVSGNSLVKIKVCLAGVFAYSNCKQSGQSYMNRLIAAVFSTNWYQNHYSTVKPESVKATVCQAPTPEILRIFVNQDLENVTPQENPPFSKVNLFIQYVLNMESSSSVFASYKLENREGGIIDIPLAPTTSLSSATHEFNFYPCYEGMGGNTWGHRTDTVQIEKVQVRAISGDDKWKDCHLEVTDRGVYVLAKKKTEHANPDYTTVDGQILHFDGNLKLYNIGNLVGTNDRLEAISVVDENALYTRYMRGVSGSNPTAYYQYLPTTDPYDLEKTLPKSFAPLLEHPIHPEQPLVKGEYRTKLYRSYNIVGGDHPLILRGLGLRIMRSKQLKCPYHTYPYLQSLNSKLKVMVIDGNYIDTAIADIPTDSIYVDKTIYQVIPSNPDSALDTTKSGYLTHYISFRAITKSFFIYFEIENMAVLPPAVYYEVKGRIVESNEILT